MGSAVAVLACGFGDGVETVVMGADPGGCIEIASSFEPVFEDCLPDGRLDRPDVVSVFCV